MTQTIKCGLDRDGECLVFQGGCVAHAPAGAGVIAMTTSSMVAGSGKTVILGREDVSFLVARLQKWLRKGHLVTPGERKRLEIAETGAIYTRDNVSRFGAGERQR